MTAPTFPLMLMIVTIGSMTAMPQDHVAQDERMIDLSPVTTFHEGRKNVTVAMTANQNWVELCENYDVTFSIANNSGYPLPVHNLYLVDIIDRYAVLAIYNHRGKYLGNLLKARSGGSVGPIPNHLAWCSIQPKTIEEVRLVFTAGVADASGFLTLPPGEYRLQMIVDRRFFSESPWQLPYYECGADRTSRKFSEFRSRLQQLGAGRGEQPQSELGELLEKWLRKNPPGELMRSNIITIEFRPKPIEAMKPGRVGQTKASRRLLLEGE